MLISFWASKKEDRNTAEGYFRFEEFGAYVIAGSLLLTNLSTEQIVGLNGLSFREGILVVAWELLACLALVFFALFFLPKMLKLKVYSITEYFRLVYGESTAKLVAWIFLIAYVLILLPVILYSGSLALSSIFDFKEIFEFSKFTNLCLCICFIATLGSLYSTIGGLRAVAISDSINAIALFIAGSFIPIVIFDKNWVWRPLQWASSFILF